MKNYLTSREKWLQRSKQAITVLICVWCFSIKGLAQQDFVVNLAGLDGVAITPDNIFSYTVQSPKTTSARVKGTIRYKTTGLFLSYTFTTSLQPGINTINKAFINPQWNFSSSSLRTLFNTYGVLPEGTYEYCVSVTPVNTLAESGSSSFDECLYHRQDGIFSINLIDPEDKAKLREYNPALSWIANYSFSTELKYRLRIAEIKQNQNPVNAVMRNQPLYDERNLVQNSVVYPVYAKPLEKNKRYAWTVDAYYNEILLGGAETWEFMIIEDTPLSNAAVTRSYVDVRRENGKTKLVFAGEMKLKYLLDERKTDILTLTLLDDNNKPMKFRPSELNVKYGDNRYSVNLKDSCNLKHNKAYLLDVDAKSGSHYAIPFRYLNPDYLVK